MPGSAAKLLDLLAIPPGERQFNELGGGRRIAAGSALPPPIPVFPRYVDSEASAQT
jgi:methionyl-tRNA synthetase